MVEWCLSDKTAGRRGIDVSARDAGHGHGKGTRAALLPWCPQESVCRRQIAAFGDQFTTAHTAAPCSRLPPQPLTALAGAAVGRVPAAPAAPAAPAHAARAAPPLQPPAGAAAPPPLAEPRTRPRSALDGASAGAAQQ